MKIALLGYGKMGHEVEKTAVSLGHTIGVVIDNEQDWLLKVALFRDCDVAIEFSTPAIVTENIKKCFETGIPVVVGTTGWYDRFDIVADQCNSSKGTLFYASNFSVGVNIFFEINRRLAFMLNDYPMYSPAMSEIHHLQKLDAPSGTAISLAKDIIEVSNRIQRYTTSVPQPGEIPVSSVREGSVTGTHTIIWSSETDEITIIHEAKNRSGFAQGAVMAAEWVLGRQGIYTMKDMLNS
ncbi:MAG: 4-hydroxy-tetrahydrodipicolinate reductase [Bacteroidota bacterium]